MKVFKTERDWKDLERADKVAIFVGVFVWVILETGCVFQAKRHTQLQNNVIKSEMVKHR
jgi:hypothetical protein